MKQTGKKVKYPVGEQDFKMLREAGCVYVDKTAYIEKIIESGSKYYFLARPRRFGKSLFLSTLHYFFEGRRELFKDLVIDKAEWDWKAYPVLHLDLNIERYGEPGKLDEVLDNIFRGWETSYGVTPNSTNPSLRFRNIIEAAHEKTGMPVLTRQIPASSSKSEPPSHPLPAASKTGLSPTDTTPDREEAPRLRQSCNIQKTLFKKHIP